MNSDLINIIFGMKVRRARMEAGLTLTEFAARCELSPSYVTEIEKGRKHPKADKILRMAQILDKEYDDLVSIKLAPSMAYLETALASPLLQEFPFEAFGLEIGTIVNLFTRAPAKASALIHAILEIGRRYNLKEEHFLRAAMRSYQELRDNYFQELEDAAVIFGREHGFTSASDVTIAALEEIIIRQFGYRLDRDRLANDTSLSSYRSVTAPGARPRLLLNSRLSPSQIRFLLAREIGYRYLALEERAYESAPERVSSFQQVFNDFQASYFAGALLMPREPMLRDLQRFLALDSWQPEMLLGMLETYDVTPEMLLYRLSELFPQFFGLKLHFLRFHAQGDRYQLVKQLNMNRLPLPSGIARHEHFCRRWLSIRLFRDLRQDDMRQSDRGAGQVVSPAVGAQLSEFYDSGERFLCMGFARPLALQPDIISSVIVGLRVDRELRQDVRFLLDPAIPSVIINEICERCPLTPEQCTLRAVPAHFLDEQRLRERRQEALHQLMAELRG